MDTSAPPDATPATALPAAPTVPFTGEKVLGCIAAGMAALMPIAILSNTESQTFSVKYALLVVLAAAGAVPLVRLARASRYAWQARAAIAFVAVGVLSALLSTSKQVGFFGLYAWGEGVLFLLGLAGAWAIGTSLGPTTRQWLAGGFIVGAVVNGVAALVQTLVPLNTPSADLSGFGLFDGTQADGMMGNPIHLEAILLGGLALLLGRTCRGDKPGTAFYAVLTAILAAALDCSSERYGVLLLALLALYAVYAYRRRSVAYVASAIVGFGAAFFGGAGVSLSQRVAASTVSTTFTLRIRAAVTGAVATLEHRPLFGFGPGQVRDAVTLYQSKSLATRIGPGRYFTDLHDFLANILVMTGLIGFALFVAWLIGSSWRVRGAFAGVAGVMLVVELAEPMNVAVTSLAFLALGAALSASRGEPWTERGWLDGKRSAWLVTSFACVALLPAVALVAGDVALHRAQLNFSLPDAQTANKLLPIWPVTANEIAQVDAYQGIIQPQNKHAELELARQWSRTAAQRDPADNEGWVLVTAADIELGDIPSALADAATALRDDPDSVDALSADGTAHAASGSWDQAIADYERAISLAPTDAKLKPALQAAERHDRAFFLGGGA